MVRDNRWKLVACHGSDASELYDLQEDRAETTNLWTDPDSQADKTRMLKRLSDRMAETVDPLPNREAGW